MSQRPSAGPAPASAGSTAAATGPSPWRDEAEIVAALRAGSEDAFMWLVDAYGPAMLRVAGTYVPSRAVAEEVVQETWLAVLEGISRFEGRSSLRTWIFRILMNRAITRGRRERRSVPFSSVAGPELEPGETAVDPSRFLPPEHRWAGHWSAAPRRWDLPEDRLVGKETLQVLRESIAELPPAQRAVITLRDVQGWSSAEVGNVLDVSETNQRVLLHRARSKVRRALERYLDELA
jgi:RNA polymerase sigma-70 factor, ECF subfamily